MNSEPMDLTVTRYKCKTPLHEKVLYVVCAIACVVLYFVLKG